MARGGDLDGPRLTYGGPTGSPVRERRRLPASTLVLLALCLLLTVLLVVTLQRGRDALQQVQPTPNASAPPPTTAPGTPAATGSPSVTPSGSDAEPGTAVPAGATEAAARFVSAWLSRNPETRTRELPDVASAGLAEQLAGTDPAKIPKVKAVGAPRAGSVAESSARLEQRLSDSSTLSLELAADPGSRYGWLVYSVSSGTGG